MLSNSTETTMAGFFNIQYAINTELHRNEMLQQEMTPGRNKASFSLNAPNLISNLESSQKL